jgi:hypothetical protein
VFCKSGQTEMQRASTLDEWAQLEPVIAEMSLTILGVLGGFIAFGFLGLFIGPTLIAILFTLVQAWRSAVSAQPGSDVMKPAA